MKKNTIFCLLLLFISLSAEAQHTPFQKYVMPPEGFQQVFLDHVAGYTSQVITMGENQYVGQTDSDGHLYGFGRYVKSDGTQIIGQFREGELIFGITMGRTSVLVGNQDHYCSYSLTTSQLEYVFHSQERQLVDTKSLQGYAFVSMRYANGDQYIGEVYNGHRHGFGIYYYANGDIWYGSYRDDFRNGYGALFCQDNRINIGCWEAEDTRRIIYVKEKKK